MSYIIKEREHGTKTEYSLFYENKNLLGSGYGYPCDEHGNVFIEKLSYMARKGYESFRGGAFIGAENFLPPRIQKAEWNFIEPAVLRCGCGCEVVLMDPMDNVCDKCGGIYNMSGQKMSRLSYEVDPADAGERYEEDY
jgi:hypothetical protein